MYNNVLLHELYTEYKRNSMKLEHLAHLGKHVPTRVTRQPERWKVPCLGLITVYKCLSTFYQPSSTCAVSGIDLCTLLFTDLVGFWLFSILSFLGFSFLPFSAFVLSFLQLLKHFFFSYLFVSFCTGTETGAKAKGLVA